MPRGTLLPPETNLTSINLTRDFREYYTETFGANIVPDEFVVEFGQPPIESGQLIISENDYIILLAGSDDPDGGDNLRGIIGLGKVGQLHLTGEGNTARCALRVIVIIKLLKLLDNSAIKHSRYYRESQIEDIRIFGLNQAPQAHNCVRFFLPNDDEASRLSRLRSLLGMFSDLDANVRLQIEENCPELMELIPEGPLIGRNNSVQGIVDGFSTDLPPANINFSISFLQRICSACLSKRFLVLTGLAGSGKTKIAQAFARWITPDPGWLDDGDRSQGKNPNPYYALVPVGADWTGNENIIGYPNGLDTTTYITKPSLELIRHALDPANAANPHFLILDEMNLSHVERYFADILSAIESGEEVPLYEGAERTTDGGTVPRKLRLPDNLFIIGTVNVDETTYMFSPKVLDRANVIEFRMELAELAVFLSTPKAPRLEELDGKGIGFGSGFVEASGDKGRQVPASVKAAYEQEMLLFFNLLREHNAEFGYRTSYEAGRFIHFYNQLGGFADDNGDWFDGAMDAVVVQKILPKLHGSRSKLEGLLWALAWASGAERIDRHDKDFAAQLREASQAQDEAKYGPELLWSKLAAVNAADPAAAARYPLSFDKVMRMWRKLVRDQFVTFAEA